MTGRHALNKIQICQLWHQKIRKYFVLCLSMRLTSVYRAHARLNWKFISYFFFVFKLIVIRKNNFIEVRINRKWALSSNFNPTFLHLSSCMPHNFYFEWTFDTKWRWAGLDSQLVVMKLLNLHIWQLADFFSFLKLTAPCRASRASCI